MNKWIIFTFGNVRLSHIGSFIASSLCLLSNEIDLMGISVHSVIVQRQIFKKANV